ncbi:hypothetical protein [Paenibacillus qinlingensis]|uniref:DUF4062 domain-containing protein n=1 Tax=Paenibacillus qinlingensis TaxID=1837343 RepID=A0ABU1P2J9_9BACL|nr:hypothetical protein [Paenibacillus qinlingensis]MDR6553978.1 hypothetical protein [Paenibacillus qinlingensis]
MSFNALVLRVLIASPSDVKRQRNEIEHQINLWNKQFSETTGVILLPSRWEDDVVPEYDQNVADPQKLINEQLIKKCDILVGVFWTKLGTPTTTHGSGSLEEISLFAQEGKEILVYFVDDPIPQDLIDYDELPKVKKYKKEFGLKGIYAPYDTQSINNHLYKKVLKYKENLISGKCDDDPKEEQETVQVRNTIKIPIYREEAPYEKSLEQFINENELTDIEMLLLLYIKDKGDRKLGYRWKSEQTIERIKVWESTNNMKSDLSSDYDIAVQNLADRGILEVDELTGPGNVRSYALPIDKYNDLRNPKEAIKTQFKRVMKRYSTFISYASKNE